MDQYPKWMKISELSTYSKVPVTTIRSYIRQGILPAPLRTAKTMAYYTKIHLEGLLQIQKMKEKNFSLSMIKKVLADNGSMPFIPDESQPELMTGTRKDISRVAVSLFREKGYDHVTIADIAAAARISKRTFYQYFRNKEDLFCECVEAIFYDLGKDIPELQIEKDGMKRLLLRERHFERYIINVLEMLNLARYEAFMNSGQFKEKLDNAIYNFLEPIRKDMELIIQQRQSPLVNSTVLAYLYIGAVEFAYYYYLNSHDKPENIANTLRKLFFNCNTLQIEKGECQ